MWVLIPEWFSIALIVILAAITWLRADRLPPGQQSTHRALAVFLLVAATIALGLTLLAYFHVGRRTS